VLFCGEIGCVILKGLTFAKHRWNSLVVWITLKVWLCNIESSYLGKITMKQSGYLNTTESSQCISKCCLLHDCIHSDPGYLDFILFFYNRQDSKWFCYTLLSSNRYRTSPSTPLCGILSCPFSWMSGVAFYWTIGNVRWYINEPDHFCKREL